MQPDFASRLHAIGEVIVRVGLNLQDGQRLLIAEPYELQGVDRSADVIVEAVKVAAMEVGCPHSAGIEVIWSDGTRLRAFAEKKDWSGFARLVAANARMMERYVSQGDALLFLQGSQPGLMDGLAAESIAELRRIGWEHFGPVAQQLVAGATNWTVAPAPSPAWANAVYADLPREQRLAALWDEVFAATRIHQWSVPSGRAQNPSGGRVPPDSHLAVWQAHLRVLQNRRDDLNAQRLKTLRYQGDGTDLTVTLPTEHRWCTAQLTSKSGVSFVANLPTEEVFTLPHKNSAEGVVRVSRPVNYGGTVIDGIELEFRRGRVVQAKARLGNDVLNRLLDTDEGAARLGEVAIVGEQSGWAAVSRFDKRRTPSPTKGTPPPRGGENVGSHRTQRLFCHPLLDENASNHIALGDGYEFCLRQPDPAVLNRSLIHVDLSIDAHATCLP